MLNEVVVRAQGLAPFVAILFRQALWRQAGGYIWSYQTDSGERNAIPSNTDM